MEDLISKQIELLENEDLKKKFWSISKNRAIILENLCKITKPRKVLEIGTSNGYSTLFMARALQNSTITTIEVERKRYEIALENFKKVKVENKFN